MGWARNDLIIWGGNLLTYATFTALAAAIIIWFFKRRQMISLIEKIPGPKALPILGNALEVSVSPREFFKRINGFSEYGDVARIYLGLQPYALLSSAHGTETYGEIHWIIRLIPTNYWWFKDLESSYTFDACVGRTFSIGTATQLSCGREVFTRIIGLSHMWGWQDSIIRFWLGHQPYVFTYHAPQAEVILSSQKHLDKSRDYNFLHPWLGTGLLTSTGNKWRSRRKLLTPAFHFKILEDFVEVFNRQSGTLTSKLEKKADGTAFDIFPFITLCTLDVICETAMGTSINAQDNSESEYVKAVYRIGALVQQRQARPWLQPDFLYRLIGPKREFDSCLATLHNYSYSAIRTRRKEYQQKRAAQSENKEEEEVIGKKKRLAFLDLLLEYSEGVSSLSDEDIREEVDTFMFEGHDTTAAAINWSLYLLGCHPDIQAKVHEELDSIFGDSDRPVSMTDLPELKYTENCIKEALRLFPSVPFIARELKEEAVIDNYRIPVGTTVMVLKYRLHRDPEQFPNPEVFDPDRFHPDVVAKRHPYAYIPFSAGPRNCIGQRFALMEEKILVANVLRKYRIESCTRREDLKLLGELILRPEDGNMLKLFPRKAAA